MKEKFGEFTPQGEMYNMSKEQWDEYHNIIGKWEYQSRMTCEACGEPGVLKTNGWWKVRCDKCDEDYEMSRILEREQLKY